MHLVCSSRYHPLQLLKICQRYKRKIDVIVKKLQRRQLMDLMPFSKISEHNGHLFDISLVDRSHAGEQRWGVEVQMLDVKDSSPVGAVVMLSEEFISVEAARYAGNDLARLLIGERANTVR
jgi:hypothetical protein